MIRLFEVYYPARTLILLLGEALIISLSFIAAVMIRFGPDASLVLIYEDGAAKIVLVTVSALMLSYYLDLYSPERLTSNWDTSFRLLAGLGVLSIYLGAIGYLFPRFTMGKHAYLLGVMLLTASLLIWRVLYTWISLTCLRERVYVLGSGGKAERLAKSLAERDDLGIDVVGFYDAGAGLPDRQVLGEQIVALRQGPRVHRAIVAMGDRRGTLPVRELLDLRLSGVVVEEATSLLEKISGKIVLDDLYPSSLIYSEGFRLDQKFLFQQRMVSLLVGSAVLLVCMPIIPLIALAVKLSSPGPVFFRQRRVGRKGLEFEVIKFRTMGVDAEAKTGPTWAGKNDPRVTPVGAFLRRTRLDEIPQLWNVLRGDMSLVGPRPERPEFVSWLAEEIPFYHLRHIVRPGLTGWAQISCDYGASMDDTKQKLQYDLYYIKHMSLMLDLLVIFETIKTVLLRRGSR
jgi:sugar transferase (PEP-CTERM system associated)